MRPSLLRNLGLALVVTAVLGHSGCSTSRGTNTGNGAPQCPASPPCESPVTVTAHDGRVYRGRVFTDTTIASRQPARSLPNPPVAELTFGGGEVRFTDGGCQDGWPSGLTDPAASYGVRIFISTAESTIDASGTLHVHGAPRDGDFASTPSFFGSSEFGSAGWTVDLTLTAAGELTATLMLTNPPPAFLGTGGANGTGGAGGTFGSDGASASGGNLPDAAASRSRDAGTVTLRVTMSGTVDPNCIPPGIPVSGGGYFKLPCWQPEGCEPWIH